ncbi:MAG: glycosyltransferase family 2 protein [Clostridia bacterium]|nr:glycosyltransferase family 2 protein [Clostridia bacterium]
MQCMFSASVFDAIGASYPAARAVYGVLGSVFSAMIAYRILWRLLGLFFTRKFPPAKRQHRYGIVIAARNESPVIGNLLDSIARQDYPSDLLTIFVVADNCTDNTAAIAREKGAICYERFDSDHRTKGYALQFLFEKIEEDYGRDSFEGYFVFDADNLLKKDYVSRMNDAFDAGSKIITSYRNTKNFTESWVASMYALHWLRSIRFNHRPRSVLRLATNIQGTGFLFSNEIVRDGWKYTSLTEDRALTADAVAQGYEITYQDEAEFFDEQPVSIRISLRQRLRWAKGHLLAFVETGPQLLVNVIFGKRFLKNPWLKDSETAETTTASRFAESLRHRIASYDTLMQLIPFAILNAFRWLAVSVLIYGCFCCSEGLSPSYFFAGGTYLAKLLRLLFPFQIQLQPGIGAFFLSMLLAVWWRLLYRIATYPDNMWIAIYVFLIERKRIIKIPFGKKVLYTLTWPLFDRIDRYAKYVALFAKVTWKPIPHESKITIHDLKK